MNIWAYFVRFSNSLLHLPPEVTVNIRLGHSHSPFSFLLENPTFLHGFGPDDATRIAITHDGSGELTLMISNETGPVRDGGCEVIQAARLVNTEVPVGESVVISLQKCPFVNALSPSEWGDILRFFKDLYFAGRKKDVVLVAKADPDFDEDHVIYALTLVEGWGAEVHDVTMFVDDIVLMPEDKVFVLVEGRVGVMTSRAFFSQLRARDRDAMLSSAIVSAAVGLETKLARGILYKGKVQTLAYVKSEPRGKMLVLLDAGTLKEVDALSFQGDYVTGDRSGRTAYIVTEVDTGQPSEDGIVSMVHPVPAEEFGTTI